MYIDYLKLNKDFWSAKYAAPNVEGFIFRLKRHVLDLYLKNKNKRLQVLDYGCGEGSNIAYLANQYKYIPYGVDISPTSINVCKKKLKKYKKNFKLIKSETNSNDNFFNVKFDLIISVQVLYYLDNEDLHKRLLSFKKMLKPNGFIFITMTSKKSAYWKIYSNRKVNSQGLTVVDFSRDKNYKKRHKQTVYKHFINFIKNEKDLVNKCKMFKKKIVGYYDDALQGSNSSGHHFTFFGQNK